MSRAKAKGDAKSPLAKALEALVEKNLVRVVYITGSRGVRLQLQLKTLVYVNDSACLLAFTLCIIEAQAVR